MTTPLDAIAIESVSDVCPIFVPLIIILSTVSVVKVPKLVIADCAAVVTVAAEPVILPEVRANVPVATGKVTVTSYGSNNLTLKLDLDKILTVS